MLKRSYLPKNYLNNRDILQEIHTSKTSYCCFTKPEYADYDIIVESLEEINEEKILEGIQARKERLAVKVIKESSGGSNTVVTRKKLDDALEETEEVGPEEVIFRVMVSDHIPIDEEKTAKAISRAVETKKISAEDTETDDTADRFSKKIRVNFPAFQHWKLVNGELTCVGKSHWKGDLETGEFSSTHGRITDKLCTMYEALVTRYGTRSNWRGYSYNEEMRGQALVQLVDTGLMFNEFKSQNPFAYLTAIVTNSFTRILNEEKTHQEIRDDLMEMSGLTPSFTRQMSSDD